MPFWAVLGFFEGLCGWSRFGLIFCGGFDVFGVVLPVWWVLNACFIDFGR